MNRFGGRIKELFQSRPVTSNVVVYSLLYGAADLSQQTVLHQRRDFNSLDFTSASHVAFVGGAFCGTLYPFWYKWLDGRFVGTTTKILLKKVALDQGVVGAVGCAVFFAVPALLEGRGFGGAKTEVQTKWAKAYFTGWAYWPAVQLFNFRLLPTFLRAPYVAMAAFVWTNIICFIRSQQSRPEPSIEAG